MIHMGLADAGELKYMLSFRDNEFSLLNKSHTEMGNRFRIGKRRHNYCSTFFI